MKRKGLMAKNAFVTRWLYRILAMWALAVALAVYAVRALL